MHRPLPGWYCYIAPTASRPMTDLLGPFDTRHVLIAHLSQHRIRLVHELPAGGGVRIAVPLHSEMTDDFLEGEDYAPRATGIHQVK